MKKLVIFISLTSILGSAYAQQAGTIDQTFADKGRYAFSVPEHDVWTTFLTAMEWMDEDRLQWKVLAGGNQSKDYQNIS